MRIFLRPLAVATVAHDVGAHVVLVVVVIWRSTWEGGSPAAVIIGLVRRILVQNGPGGVAGRFASILEGLAVHQTLERSLLLDARESIVAAGDAAAADARDVAEQLAAAGYGGGRKRGSGRKEEKKKGGGNHHCH